MKFLDVHRRLRVLEDMEEQLAYSSALIAEEMRKMKRPEIELFLDGARGIYLPRDFAFAWIDRRCVLNVSDKLWRDLEQGPEHLAYHEAWEAVLNSAVIIGDNGVEYTLHMDEDLFIVPVGMEWSDAEDAYVWPVHH